MVRPRAVAAPGSSQPVPPFNIVITGGSKGVGRALAAEFLRAGDNVVICARDGAQRRAAVVWGLGKCGAALCSCMQAAVCCSRGGVDEYE